MAKAKREQPVRVSPPRQSSDRGVRVRPLLHGLALGLLTIITYVPALRGGFLWDDDEMLVRNSFVHSPSGLYDIWLTSHLGTYFPLTSSMFWLEWHLWGDDPTGYYFVNVLLHALSAVVLWRILRRLRVPGAWVAAAVLAVHPVTVASVAWIAERKNTLSLLLCLSALLAFLRFEDEKRRLWYGTALAAFVLAMLAKTSVVMLPVVLLALAWYRRGAIARTDVVRVLPFVAWAAVLGAVTVGVQHAPAFRPESLASRLAAAGWVVWFYLESLLVPVRLTMIYPRWQVDPAWLPAWPPLLALVVLALVCWRRRDRWGRPVLVALVVFVAMLFPVLGLVGWSFHEYSLVSDHLQYAALAGPIALVVGSAAAVLQRRRIERRAVVSLALVLVAVLSWLTWTRATVFESGWTLWRDTLDKNPAAWAAHNNLGRLLADSGRLGEAKDQYREAIELHPAYAHAHNNLGVVLGREGSDGEAEGEYRTALRLDPEYAEAHSNLGNLLARTGRPTEAVEHQRAAVEIQPDSPEVRTNLGSGLQQLGLYDAALAEYDQALRLSPGLAEAHYNRGAVLLASGRPTEAAESFRAALRLAPDLRAAEQGLALAMQSAMGARQVRAAQQ